MKNMRTVKEIIELSFVIEGAGYFCVVPSRHRSLRMTAGGGILHEEMSRRGPDGMIDGFQLWVNLPAAQKITRPRYQEIGVKTIPVF